MAPSFFALHKPNRAADVNDMHLPDGSIIIR